MNNMNDDHDYDGYDTDNDEDCGKVSDEEGGCPHYPPWHCQVAFHYALQHQCMPMCTSMYTNVHQCTYTNVCQVAIH